jgi:nucleoside 2-deoxyribosyltransferase
MVNQALKMTQETDIALSLYKEARNSEVDWGTMAEAGRSRVPIPMK